MNVAGPKDATTPACSGARWPSLALPAAPGWSCNGRKLGVRRPHGSASARSSSVPSGCSLARLVMADPEVLPKAERSLVLHLLDQVPPLADAITVAKRLNALLRRKASESLERGSGCGRPDAAEGVCRRPTPRHRRHPSSARPAVDHQPRGGTGEPPEDAEADHVWSCRVPAPACPRPPRRMTE